MSVATIANSSFRPLPVYPDDDRFVSLAAELGAKFAQSAAEHDRENSFVGEHYELLRQSGYTRLAVPEELGGLGATLRQVCYAQAELAKHCASTALAINMHLYGTLTNAYNWRHGAEAAGNMLRRVVNDGLIVMTSGGSDGIFPSGTAQRVDGGFRVNARKMFCSQAPIANILTTMATYDDPENGPVVLMIAVPTKSDGAQIIETWDALGMRGTGSHDMQFYDVFIADAQVVGRRPWGKVDPILCNALLHFAPTTASVYFGIAAGARDEAVRLMHVRKAPSGEPLANDQMVQREIGLIDSKLRTSWWALAGALNDIGADYTLTEEGINAVLIAKRHILEMAGEIIDLAMETVGGSSYFKRSPLERAYRDVRAGKYHPLTPEKSLLYAGRTALGLSVDDIW
jgi:acyl-CoA dehydrogenase